MNTKTAKPTTTEIARTLRATATTHEQAVALVATLTRKQLDELAKRYDAATYRGIRTERLRDAVVNATWGDRVRMAGMLASLRAYNGNEATLMNLRMVGAR
jgi:hypothetical protein